MTPQVRRGTATQAKAGSQTRHKSALDVVARAIGLRSAGTGRPIFV